MQADEQSAAVGSEAEWLKFEPMLRRYIRRRAPALVVDDILQEVWLRLISLRDQSGIVEIERYLFVVASSVLARHYNKAGAADNLAAALLPESSHDLHPERIRIGRERVQVVAETLASLPERTRQIFVLNRFEELTYRRIAQELGISISAVEKHVMKALKALVAADRGEP